jgi:hypothetical protein
MVANKQKFTGHLISATTTWMCAVGARNIILYLARKSRARTKFPITINLLSRARAFSPRHCSLSVLCTIKMRALSSSKLLLAAAWWLDKNEGKARQPGRFRLSRVALKTRGGRLKRSTLESLSLSCGHGIFFLFYYYTSRRAREVYTWNGQVGAEPSAAGASRS